MIVTYVLDDIWPNLKVGPATVSHFTMNIVDQLQALKSQLISNKTLAQLSDRYHLSSRLIANRAALITVRDQEKTKAALFEAYVAGVIADKRALLEGRYGGVSLGSAIDQVQLWLRDLYKPLIFWVREEFEKTFVVDPMCKSTCTEEAMDAEIELVAAGSTQWLNEFVTGRMKSRIPQYESREIVEEKMWEVTCNVQIKGRPR